jgi:hypothetical protein
MNTVGSAEPSSRTPAISTCLEAAERTGSRVRRVRELKESIDTALPIGTDGMHRVKHNGYRLMARRDPVGIRLITGNDWAAALPASAEALNHLRVPDRRQNGLLR